MDSDKRIAVVDFEHDIDSFGNNYDERNMCYCVRSEKSKYFLNCQSSIWRRKDLIKMLSPYESPWQFEIFGSKRAVLYNKEFLLFRGDKKVFSYDFNWRTGYGIYGGKLLKSNIKLFENNNIVVNFNNLGFFEPNTRHLHFVSPKVTLSTRIRYLLFSGGYIKNRMGIREQICLLYRTPHVFLQLIKYKIKKTFSNSFFEY